MEKPTFKQRVDSFIKFLYNSEESTVLGRGGRNWAEIGLFYLVYYACLAGFFAITLAVFYQTMDKAYPALQGDSSLLKGNPGMGYQPMPDIDTTLVRSIQDYDRYKGHIDAMTGSIDKVLKPYKEGNPKTVNCDNINTTRDDAKEACEVDYALLTEKCNIDNHYGMANNTPCVLLKLNKIFGWKPDVWETKEEARAAGLPENLVEKYTNDKIWVVCQGENPADKDDIGNDEITYYPDQGFPLRYYPYMKQEGYLAPMVFVRFGNVKRSLGLMIECKAFAKNIEVDQQEKEGSVHFELLLDPQGDRS